MDIHPIDYFREVRQVSAAEAGGIHTLMREYARKLHIKDDVALLVSESPHPNMFASLFGKTPKKPCVIITQGMLDFAKTSLNATEIPVGLKGFIAHEMTHISDGLMKLNASRILPLFAMPALAVGAMSVYHGIVDKARKEDRKADAAHINGELQQSLSDICARTEKHDMSTGDYLLRGATYLAALAVGAGAGLALSRNASLQSEFRANRMGAKLCGDPQEYIRFFEKFDQAMKAAITKEITFTYKVEPYMPSSDLTRMGKAFADRLKGAVSKYMSDEKEWLKLEAIDAHPTPKQIAEDIRRHVSEIPQGPAI